MTPSTRLRDAVVRRFGAASAGLHVPSFARFFVAQTTSVVGTWFQNLAMSLFVLELTGSPFALGVTTAAQFAPMLVAVPLAGVLGDRRGARTLLIVAASAGAAISALLAAVASAGELTLPRLLVAALLIGVVNSVERPLGQSFLPELVGADLVPNAVGMVTVSQSAARLVGPALAGVTYAAFGATVCFALNGISYVVAASLLWSVRPDTLHVRPIVSRADSQFRRALRYVAEHERLWPLLVANAIIGVLALNFLATIDSIVYLSLGGSAADVGAAHALNAAGAVLGGLVVSSTRRSLTSAVPWVCLLFAGTLALQASAPDLTWFLLVCPVFGLGFAAYSGVMYASVQQETDDRMLGRVMSLVILGHVGTTPIGGVLIGWVMTVWSPRGGMYLGAVGALLGALLVGARQRLPAARPEGTDHGQ